MKAPQHTIKQSTLKAVASEELQAEVGQELASAAPEEETPSMEEVLASAEAEDEVSDEEEDEG